MLASFVNPHERVCVCVCVYVLLLLRCDWENEAPSNIDECQCRRAAPLICIPVLAVISCTGSYAWAFTLQRASYSKHLWADAKSSCIIKIVFVQLGLTKAKTKATEQCGLCSWQMAWRRRSHVGLFAWASVFMSKWQTNCRKIHTILFQDSGSNSTHKNTKEKTSTDFSWRHIWYENAHKWNKSHIQG
jgi:hypothetical protein